MNNLKDLKISNTLLSEILKRPVEIINIDEYKCMIRNSTYFGNEQRGIVYRYLYGNKEIRFMSIYELAFKCKEWAKEKNLMLVSGYYSSGVVYCSVHNILQGVFNEIRGYNEIESIILLCEWILEKEGLK